MSGEPSRSAMLVAACRLLAEAQPEAERLCSDPLARLFIDQRALDAARANERLQRVVWFRTRYIDDTIAAFADQHAAAQVLLLGAGLDARAFRMEAGGCFFEVDTADTLAYKDSVVEKAGLAPSGRRIAGPVDLASDPI